MVQDRRTLIDGAASNYAPISHAVDLGADTAYVLTSDSACALARPPQGAIPIFLHSSSLAVTRRLLVEAELLADRVELVVLPPPCPLSVAPHDFSKADELIAASLRTSRVFLEGAPVPPLQQPLSEHLRGHVTPQN
jgi:NTE family protein